MPPSPERGRMDWRGRLETRTAWWTLLAGVPLFVASATAIPTLVGFAVFRTIEADRLSALWALAGALLMLRATLVSIEALGQLRWRRLLDALAPWAVAVALWPGWWLGRG